MLKLEDLYTGYTTHDGHKIYLGDRLYAKFYHPMLVQYDFVNNKFVVTDPGKQESPYRSYLLSDMVQNPGLRILRNIAIYSHAAVGDIVEVTQDNVKGKELEAGEKVKVVEVKEWSVLVESEERPGKTVELKFGEFLENWRLV